MTKRGVTGKWVVLITPNDKKKSERSQPSGCGFIEQKENKSTLRNR